METFSVLLAFCEGNPPVTGGLPSQRPVLQSFDVFTVMEYFNKQVRCVGISIANWELTQ